MSTRACRDCRLEGLPLTRPAPHPGPRCVTHHRAFRKATSLRTHSRVILSKYGISGEQYAALYAFQGGRCAICQRARGKSKRLAVDHNHITGEVRGLLCGPCNGMLAHARDDPVVFERGANYLLDPPFRRMTDD